MVELCMYTYARIHVVRMADVIEDLNITCEMSLIACEFLVFSFSIVLQCFRLSSNIQLYLPDVFSCTPMFSVVTNVFGCTPMFR